MGTIFKGGYWPGGGYFPMWILAGGLLAGGLFSRGGYWPGGAIFQVGYFPGWLLAGGYWPGGGWGYYPRGGGIVRGTGVQGGV